MRKIMVIIVLLVVSIGTLMGVFMEEELTAQQFGFSGEVNTVKIEIVKKMILYVLIMVLVGIIWTVIWKII